MLIWVVGRAVFAPGRITYHRIMGAILLYLAIGLTFAALYASVGLLSPDAYAAMIAHLGVDPARSLFVEDMARNLTPAKALGMTTVWLDNGSESGHRDHLPGHVDFHATDIADWLDTLPQPWGIS